MAQHPTFKSAYYISVQILKQPLFVLALIVVSVSIAFLSSKIDLLALFFPILLVGLIFVLVSIIKPELGFFAALILPMGSFELERYIKLNIPIGLLLQAIFFYLLIILLFKNRIKSTNGFNHVKNSISYVIIFTYCHFIIQGFNPNMDSFNGWLFAIRSITGIYLIYYVTLFIFNDLKIVKQFFYLWIILASICAVYACYQEWFGLPSFIINYIHSDPLKLGLYYINGKYRIFSLLSDPAAFGIFMSGSFLVTFVLILYSRTNLKRVLFIVAAFLMLLACAFSGTRTSYVMIPAGLLLFTLMTITNKKTLIVTTMVSLVFAVLLFGPFYGNVTLNRIRSTFNGDDASLNVRDVNRANIQKYIYDHPLGGGVMTSGVAGLEYNPEHRLAGFPPDSGYLQTVLEVGWLGLIILLLFFFISIRLALKRYYQSSDNRVKPYYLSVCLFVFSVAIASYAQVVVGQYPISLFIFSSLAIVSRLKEFENQEY